MQELAQKGHTRQTVIDTLQMKTGSRQIKFRYDILDKNDNLKKTLTTVIDGEISMSAFADIKRTARFTVKDDNSIDWLNDRIQPFYMLKINKQVIIIVYGIFAGQKNAGEFICGEGKKTVQTTKSDWLEWPLGVFILSSPKKQDNIIVTREVEAYDLSQILIDDKFVDRYTINVGTNYITAIKSLLTGTGIAKINIAATDKILSTAREFEIGTTKLSAINKLLSEINYTQMVVDEYGYFVSSPYRSPSDRVAEYTYKDDSMSILNHGMTEELDLFSVPNKWVVVLSNPELEPLSASYVNDNPASITSTISRGRTIVDFREVDNIADQESLDAYVQRIANNASQVYGYINFETAIMPHHSYSDVLNLEYSKLNISGKYSETNWTLPLKAGAMMQHQVRRVVNI